eukprot:11227586-Lingulodinium_polyedra.AAC.1
MLRGALHCRVAPFNDVSNMGFGPYRTFLAEAKEGNCGADRFSHQLTHCTVAHAVAPTATE